MDCVALAKIRFESILKKSMDKEIEFATLPASKKYLRSNTRMAWKHYSKEVALIWVIIAICFWHNVFVDDCIFEIPVTLSKAFRPPVSCEFCMGVEKVPRSSNITAEEFENRYAYSGKPLIVTDAMKNWTAVEVFDFWYFKDVYMNLNRKRKYMSCQFFAYKTGVKNLYEALNIPRERVNYQEGTSPWYFGWSNCNNKVAELLRQHYGRPYFLPATSENNAVDWIFMGGPGMGVAMHVDNVRLPSWQAQLKGAKRWMLSPPPECYFQCSMLEVTVRKGEMIVIDTNKWYHATLVEPGEISITIGAEYD